MSIGMRLLASFILGLSITGAFWVASECSSEGAYLLVIANLPAVIAGDMASNNVLHSSKAVVLVTMVVQWTLVSLLALWVIGRMQDKGMVGRKK